MVFGPVVNRGSEVWVSWTVDHGFGLADDGRGASRGSSPTTTLAQQRRQALEAELSRDRVTHDRAGGLMAFGAFSSVDRRSSTAPVARSRAALWLLLPGVVYLGATYLAPLVSLIVTSLKAPDLVNFDIGRYLYAFDIGNYGERARASTGRSSLRSFEYAAIATIFALLISYPLAYFIGVALRRYPLWQALALILVIAPFFMSFLLRTLAWKAIFADEGPVVDFLQSLNILPARTRT